MNRNNFLLKLSYIVAIVTVFVGIMLAPISSKAADSYLRYTNPTTGYSVVVQDEADLLSDIEEDSLAEAMRDCTEFGNAIFYTVENAYNDANAEAMADSIGETYFGSQSQTVVLIAMDIRYIYMSSYGANKKIITNAKSRTITDNIYTYASSGNYYQVGYKAFEQTYTLLNGGKIAEPMRYICSGLLAVICALMINFLIVNASSGLKKPSMDEVLGPVAKRYTPVTPDIQHVNSTRTYSPQSSGSSGGGGGHHGGGGHSGGHSGGGHHF